MGNENEALDLLDFFENSVVPMRWVGSDGVILRANQAELDLLGYTHAEYVGRPIADFHVDQAATRDILDRLLRGEKLVKVPGTLRAKDGSHRHVLISSSGRFRGGELVNTRCVTIDVTAERKQAEQRLAADLRATTLLRDVGILCVREGVHIDQCMDAILDAAIEITGADKGDIQLLDRDHGVLRIAAQRGFEQAFPQFFAEVRDDNSACGAAMRSGGRVIVEDVTTSDIFAGQPSLEILLAAGVRAVQSTPLVSSVGRLLGMISTHFARPTRLDRQPLSLLDVLARQAADYLERKQAEDSAKHAQEALRQSELRWRTMTEALPNLVWTDLPDGQCDWLSSQWGTYTGIPEQQLLGLTWLDTVIHPDDRERTLAAWQAACADRADYDLEYRIRRHDGQYRWFKTRGVPVRDDSGRIVYWFGTCTDIEDIRQAEQRERALIESNLAATAKFEAVFNQSGIFAAITDLDGKLLEVNDLAVICCGYSREQVLNKPFWEGPWWRGSEQVRASIREAIHQAAQGNVYRDELSYWLADGSERVVTFAMHPIRDQTGTVRFLHPTGFDITEHKGMEEALRDSEATFRAMFSISSVGKAQVDPRSGRFLRVNSALSGLTGYTESELLQRGFPDITHPDDWSRDGQAMQRLLSGADDKFDLETRYLKKDGGIVWVRSTINLISDRGRPLRATAVIQDITYRKQAEEQANVLLREVNHRAKNMLSLVLAIARQTAASDGASFLARFEERVQALSASQDVLVASGWKNVPAETLIRAQLAHFRDLLDDRIVLDGPALNLTAQAAQTIGMALHELATNASKYGALSLADGRVEIRWRVERGAGGDLRFRIGWAESGGPQVTPPVRRGFGSTVLERVAKMSLNAESSLSYASAGLVWQLECSAQQVLEDARAESEVLAQPIDLPKPDFGKARILVVEDEILAAMEITAELIRAGFAVLGPVASVVQALGLLQQGCEAAVLDVNLGGETSEPVASAMTALGKPFITVSSYARGQLPPAFADAPLLNKPVRRGLLAETLMQCLEPADGDVPALRLQDRTIQANAR